MLGILTATLLVNLRTANFTGVSVIFAEVLVIAGVLRVNRMRADAAERSALELSRIDALTRLANRRVFERTLSIAAEVPNGASTSGYDRGGLILADVDNFKTINSTGGHKAGDEVLRMIAAVLDGTVGQQATVCRIGGDEFAVIVQDGNAAELSRTAAKLRAAIGAVDWNVLSAAPVTLSMGYATWEHVESWKDIVVASDLALRASKDAGKNAVTSAPQDEQAPRVPRIGPDQALAG
jgi:diguanylate cyclase (GGDEF)-like protein